MSDSSPRSGDWDNIMRGVYVAGACVIIGVFLFVLFVTGHAVAAMWIIISISLGSLAVWALQGNKD